MREFEHIDFIAKEVMHHNIYRTRYVSKGSKVQTKEALEANVLKRNNVFKKLLSYVDSKLLLKKASKKLLDINETYIKFLKEEGCEQISS